MFCACGCSAPSPRGKCLPRDISRGCSRRWHELEACDERGSPDERLEAARQTRAPPAAAVGLGGVIDDRQAAGEHGMAAGLARREATNPAPLIRRRSMELAQRVAELPRKEG